MNRKILVFLLVCFPLLFNACERSALDNSISNDDKQAAQPTTGVKGLNVIEIAGTQTAQAGIGVPTQTRIASGTSTVTASNDEVNFPTPTSLGGVAETGLTQPAATATPGMQSAATKVASTQAPPATSVPPANPGTYVMKEGEFPYCIARRFDVDPGELMTLNGISPNQTYFPPGTEIKIPTSGNTFPSERSLEVHPTTYSVGYGETLYTIACKFGDVDPNAIAAANGIAVDSELEAGTVLQIP
ncbi:MAG TPA: LysM peptidoglycan-binding domain-containing protein [Anaerolineales bacterium]|nr:LysM peptidoglycan-binding domain-containing protein [Anaerolineales bacterium]